MDEDQQQQQEVKMASVAKHKKVQLDDSDDSLGSGDQQNTVRKQKKKRKGTKIKDLDEAEKQTGRLARANALFTLDGFLVGTTFVGISISSSDSDNDLKYYEWGLFLADMSFILFTLSLLLVTSAYILFTFHLKPRWRIWADTFSGLSAFFTLVGLATLICSVICVTNFKLGPDDAFTYFIDAALPFGVVLALFPIAFVTVTATLQEM